MGWEEILGEEDYNLYRKNISLLEEQVLNNFIHSFYAPDILSAIRKVPRHLFVSESYRYMAYTDNAIPTYGGLTTSAPSVIAEMIYASGIKRGEKLLEIGTGTGYEAALLCEMGVDVFTIEINGYLAKRANKLLSTLGYKIDNEIKDKRRKRRMLARYYDIRKIFPERGTVRLFMGNGQFGLKRYAPYRAIIIAASVPQLHYITQIMEQLDENEGKLVVPVGKINNQQLYIIERKGKRFSTSILEGITLDFVRLFRE